MSSFLSLCYPVAQVKIVSASLAREGFSAFSVEGEDADNRRFLKRTSSYNCGVMEVIRENANNTTTVLWTSYKDGTSIEETVDPFTGLVCRAGDVHYASNIGAVSKTEDEEQRSPTFKRFDYSSDCPQCEGSGIAQFEEIRLSDAYDDAAVEANLDTLLNNHNFTDIPEWDVSGEVIPGTDGDSALSLRQAPTGQAWKAEHTVDGDTIRKTKIQVRFLADTTYTVSTEAHLNPRDGEVRQAQKGEVVTFNAPAEPGAYFQVHACQALTACLYPSSTHETDTSASEIVDGIEDDDGDCPYELNARYIGGDGKRYKNYRTDQNFNESFSYAIDFSSYFDVSIDPEVDPNPASEEEEWSWSGSYSNVDSTYSISKTCEEAVGTTGTNTTTWNESEDSTFTSCYDDECNSYGQDGTISGNVVTTYDDGASELTTNESEEEGTYDTFGGGFTRFNPVTASYPFIGRCNCSASEDPDFSVYRVVNFNPNQLAGEGTAESSSERSCNHTTNVLTQIYSIEEASGVGDYIINSYVLSNTRTFTDTLIDPAETKVNYPKSIIPNDDEDGNRDGETCASVEYSGSRRTETSVDSMDVSVDVVISFTNPQNYRTYIAWVVSELDESDPNCPQLKISQESQLIDNRYVKEGSYTVSFAKHQPVGSSEDGKTKCVTSVESYVVTDWEIV